MGRARPPRDLGLAGFGHRRGNLDHGHQRTESGRHRHHQPARDDHRLGFGDRGADLQRHRLAGPPHVGLLRRTEETGAHRHDPSEDRSDHRRLFQRHEDQVDSGQCRRGPQACRERQADVRYGGHVAHLAPYARRGPCDGCEQRLAHDALQHQHAGLGPGAARPVRHSAFDDARGQVLERGLRTHQDHDLRPQGPHFGYRRRPAGRAPSRAWSRTPMARAASC